MESTDTYQLYGLNVFFLISSGLIFFLIITFLIVLYNTILEKYDTYLKKFDSINEPLLLHCFEKGVNPNIFPSFIRTKRLRNQIVYFASQLKGNKLTIASQLYIHLGFFKKDLQDLNHYSRLSQTLALKRLRTFKINLPNDYWKAILSNENPIMIWSSLEYLVQVKREKSLLWVLNYAYFNKDLKKGMILHLFSCIAEKHPETISFLLRYVDDPELVELILKTLVSYPCAESLVDVISSIKSNSDTESIIAATKVLSSIPSEESLEVFKKLRSHSHWVVRMVIAKSLSSYEYETIREILLQSSIDISYLVRSSAVFSLIKHSPESDNDISDIVNDTDHPSNDILNNFTLKSAG